MALLSGDQSNASELGLQARLLLKWLYYCLALFIILWVLTPYKLFFAGISLGLLIGIINAAYTAYKVHSWGVATSTNKKRPGLGMGTRFSMAALGAVLIILLPEWFSVGGYLIGLMMMPAFAIGVAIYFNFKTQQARERGESNNGT